MQNKKPKKRNLISYELRLSEIQKPLPDLPIEIKQRLKQLTDGCTIYLPRLQMKKLPALPKH